MRCPVCIERGERSTVTPRGSSTTCMAYTAGHYNESGKWIKHRDPNLTRSAFTCSNNHWFEIASSDGDADRIVGQGDIKVTRPADRPVA